jgi:broad specificity phosphatase PhoE
MYVSYRYCFVFQNIKAVVASPFLRCLQTGQIVCDVLKLPGLSTSNEVMDVLNSSAFIHWQPEVPADDIESHGIKVQSFDSKPVPRYPEDTGAGLKRY